MNLNNVYNFKNPVKHFLNIDNLEFPSNITEYPIDNLTWTEPIKFRIYKEKDKYRTLKMPNILNFVAAYYHYKNLPEFEDIQSSDWVHKRLVANVDTGDFASGQYDLQLEGDFNCLCIYDNLIRLDIKEYYGRIYTHNLDFSNQEERYLTNMNTGATNGLLMGNYLSLYFAEEYLSKISHSLENKFIENEIECDFSYFSDDFYFFCNKKDNEEVVRIFDEVLESYNLERSDKKRIWTYESFNNYNLVARYWKKLVAHCNMRFKSEKTNNKLYFINQMVYRMSNLDDDKLKRVFINNVFKIRYFRELPLEKFQVKEYDYHQLCFLMNFSPEAMLYSVDRLAEMKAFKKEKLHHFFKVRYRECLKKNYNEEQLYYFYAISIFGYSDIIEENKGLVAKSNNQILISYYLRDNLFGQEEINFLKNLTDEEYWFQNYHLILYSSELMNDIEASIENFLIPKTVVLSQCNKQSKSNKREEYMKFYKTNLENEKAIIREIPFVKEVISEYLELKMKESEKMFEDSDKWGE